VLNDVLGSFISTNRSTIKALKYSSARFVTRLATRFTF